MVRSTNPLPHCKQINTTTMTVEEITQGNKLIAEFMGAEFVDIISSPFPNHKAYRFKQGNNPNPHANIGTYRRIEELDYHKRWDWLMPVVEKICQISSNGDAHYYWAGNKVTDIRIFLKPKDIVFREAIKFIQWYNTQSLTPTNK